MFLFLIHKGKKYCKITIEFLKVGGINLLWRGAVRPVFNRQAPFASKNPPALAVGSMSKANKQIFEQMKKTPYNITTNFTQNDSKCNQLTSAQSVIAGCTIKNMTI